MWVRCNPNPMGRTTGDCVVRAIAIATDHSWREAYRDLCRIGELECDMPSSNLIWGLDLKDKGGRQFLLPETCPSGTGNHAVAVIDGDYYDSWDSGDEVPTYFWKLR